MRISDWSSDVCSSDLPQDRELGYAWMDLAAERMYPNFVIKRERYWQLLDADQRRNAIERGQQLLAEYGDDAAKPRLAKVLRQAKRETTGSHAGFVGGGLKIIPMTGPLAGTGITISPEEYYAPRFWNRSEERRVGTEGVSTCKYWGWP